ncbi:MAG: hypothetical protein WAL59_12150 [Roseiarcus sp.]
MFFAQAQKHDRFDVELVDLAAIDLPMYDESKHPILQYQHESTKPWSANGRRRRRLRLLKVAQFLDAGVFRGDEIQTQAAATLLSEFER